MAKPKETFNKKDKEKKRLQKRQEKRDKMDERRANSKKGKSLEDMMAYIDENGNITDKPHDPRIKRVFKQEDIRIGVPEQEEVSAVRTGVVAFFNSEKGFGFINDKQTGERIFVHINNLSEPIVESNKVSFEVEMGARGPVAINITKLP